MKGSGKKQENAGFLGNLAWKFGERISAQLVTMVVSIVLARLLDPRDYGQIALVNVFTVLANAFVTGGFANALIQKKDADRADFSAVLYCNLGIGLLLYGMLYIAAPWVAAFYGPGYEGLTPVMRVLSLRLLLSAVNSVQEAYVARKMIFRKFFWATLGGAVVSGAVGIAMAYRGFGVWALAGQYLTGSLVSTLLLQLVLNRWPGAGCSWRRLKGLGTYGSQVMLTGLLITGYEELRTLIIGRLYTAGELAFYDKGRAFPNLVISNVNTSISAVLFPRMARAQEDIREVKRLTRNAIRFSAYLMFPLMGGMAAVAEPLIRVILTEKWLPCVPLLQMFCVVYLLHPVHTAHMQALKALGRGDLYLKLELLKKGIELGVLFLVMWISVEAIVLGMAACGTVFAVVNAWPTTRLLRYSVKEQLQDLLPSAGLTADMVLSVWTAGRLLPLAGGMLLGVQVVLGALVYVLLSWVFQNGQFRCLAGKLLAGVPQRKKLSRV